MKKWLLAGFFNLLQVLIYFLVCCVVLFDLESDFIIIGTVAAYFILPVWYFVFGIRNFGKEGTFKSMVDYNVKQVLAMLIMSFPCGLLISFPLGYLAFSDMSGLEIVIGAVIFSMICVAVFVFTVLVSLGLCCVLYPIFFSFRKKWHNRKFKYPVWSGLWRYLVFYVISFIGTLALMTGTLNGFTVVMGGIFLALLVLSSAFLVCMFLFLANDEVLAAVAVIVASVIITPLVCWWAEDMFYTAPLVGSISALPMFLFRFRKSQESMSINNRGGVV